MMPLARLLYAHLLRNKARALITLIAIAVSVTGVGFCLQGLQQGHRQAMKYSRNLGRFEAVLLPTTMGANDLPGDLVAAMMADPAVLEADPMNKIMRAQVLEPIVPARGPFSGASIIGTDASRPPQTLEAGHWLDAAAPGAVISSRFRDRANLDLGGRLRVRSGGDSLETTVVGIVTVDAFPMGRRAGPQPHVADIWLPRSQVMKLGALPSAPNLVAFDLEDRDAVEAFVEAWRDKAAGAYPPATLRSVVDEAVDFLGRESSETRQMLQATSTFLWTLLAGFIVFFSLSIGARNRLRQFAILRALAMSRSQAVLSIGVEAVGFALAGWLLGMLLLPGLLAFTGPGAGLQGGAVVLISLGCALIGSLGAALPVAWKVARVKPVDILGRRGPGGGRRAPFWMTGVGILFILFNPMLILLGQNEAVREVLACFSSGRIGFGAPLLGSVLMIVGFALITPQAIRLAERLFTPPGSRLLRLDGRFLRQQLSVNLWRNVGTTVALSAGLALYITSLVWGYSMLVPFMPTDALPRMQLSVPKGLSQEGIDAVRALPGVRRDSFLPAAVEHPRLTRETLQRPGFDHVHAHQHHVLVMGVDPELAFGGDTPLFDFDYLEGDAATARKRLIEGRHCIIPDHFATQCKLKVGDRFAVEVPGSDGKEITYTVAAVADVPGWNWLTKLSGARKRAVRALAMIFVSHDQAREDYGLERITHFWFDVEKDFAPAADSSTPVQRGPRQGARGKRGGPGKQGRGAPGRGGPPGRGGNPFASPATKALAAAIQPIAATDLNLPPGATPPKVTVTDGDAIKRLLSGHAGRVIWSLTLMPLLMLLISSLAVCNTILASVRARNWQFGILRSVGMTRGQLVRLILGESLQLWLAAAALSVVSGIALGWAGTRLCTLFFFFAGRTPPLIVPWSGIALGLGVGLVVCLLGALVPAWIAGRRTPLSFIQRGRLST